VGGQSLLNFRQIFQISDITPPFAIEKTVFSPLLDQNFRKFVNFPEGGGGAAAPRPTKISAPALYRALTRWGYTEIRTILLDGTKIIWPIEELSPQLQNL
jgi:hypothetical protein